MRKIKFRGRCIDNHFPHFGEMVYGSLIAYEVNASSFHYSICSHEPVPFHVDYPVDPDSVAQLVGFDADGREVYEGDVLIDELEQEYTAEIYDRPEKIHALELKEEAKP